MSDVTQWRDATTYSRDDQERKPTCYEIKHGCLRIYITCGHIHHRPDWVLHCYALGIDTKPLAPGGTNGATLKQAQQQAIEFIEARIDEIRDDMIIIKRVHSGIVVKECSNCKNEGMQLVEPKCIGCNDGGITVRKNWEPRE